MYLILVVIILIFSVMYIMNLEIYSFNNQIKIDNKQEANILCGQSSVNVSEPTFVECPAGITSSTSYNEYIPSYDSMDPYNEQYGAKYATLDSSWYNGYATYPNQLCIQYL